MFDRTPEKDRQRELTDRLNSASYAYYVLDDPVVSDKQWDEMYDELKALESVTGVIFEDSPTRRVGGETLRGFGQHRHKTRLWSMDKVQSLEELDAWIERTEKAVGRTDLLYYLEYKFDGLTLNLTYDNGRLIQAATRGNGEVGEAVLPQALTIFSIPREIPYKGFMEVQGECIMRLSTLEKYNRTASEPLKNARNAAAGALRNLDPAVTAARHLDAFFYQIGTIDDPPYVSQPEMLDFLKRNGFQVSPFLGSGHGRQELENGIREIEKGRSGLDWQIDGAVIKVGDVALRERLGFTEKFPRWAVAYKFEAEEAVTRLENVTWELGRTGRLTPRAHLSPVDFYGVTVRRATLNNIADIERKKLAIGCDVWLRRSNDVIPEITGRAGGIRECEKPIATPQFCPACGEKLIMRGAHLYCMNRLSCRPQTVARIAHFAGREAMDIDGLSEKTAGQMYDVFGLRDPAELYKLTPADLLMLDGFQQKKAIKLSDALEKSKRCSLDAFLYALGIPNVGRKTARDLAVRYGALDRLAAADESSLCAVQDIGETVAQSVTEFFGFEENRDMIRGLLEAGVEPRNAGMTEGGMEGAFRGMSIVVTGTLPTLSRRQAEDLIRANGGAPTSSVSAKTAFVVVGADPGSKLDKARALGIETVDEAELLRRMRGET